MDLKVAILYTLPNCPRCGEIKEFLDESVFTYLIRSMDDPEALADMRFGGCYEIEAPIVQIGDKYFTYEEFMEGKMAWTRNKSVH